MIYWALVELVVSTLTGATFLWLSVLMFIEGSRRSAVTLALCVCTFGLALYIYSDLVRYVLPTWNIAQTRFFLWLSLIGALGWCAGAIIYTRSAFNNRRFLYHRRLWLLLTIYSIVVALIGTFNPSFFLSTVHIPGVIQIDFLGTPWYALAILQVQLPLIFALVLYIQARQRLKGGLGMLRLLGATVSAASGALLIELETWRGPIWGAFLGTNWKLQWPGMSLLLIAGLCLLGAISTNRRLLGRRISTHNLFFRWFMLALLLICLELSFVLGGTSTAYTVLVPTTITPFMVAVVDWASHRRARRNIAALKGFARATLSDWNVQVTREVCEERAQHVLDTLTTYLDAQAAYVWLQATPSDEPFVVLKSWSGRQPVLDDENPIGDREIIERDNVQLGFIEVVAPRKTFYSAQEMDLVKLCGFNVATMYLDAWRSESLERLVAQEVKKQRESCQLTRKMLHDPIWSEGVQTESVVGNLHRIILDVDSLPSIPNMEVEQVKERVTEAADASLKTIRKLLLNQVTLSGLYSATLAQHGLIAALQEFVVWLASEQKSHWRSDTTIEFHIEHTNINDTVLKEYVDDDLSKTLYDALAEAIRNVVRHVPLTRSIVIVMQIRLTESHLVFEVKDNGPGFTPELSPPEEEGGGIVYSRRELSTYGGTLRVLSRHDVGTRVEVTMPRSALRTMNTSSEFTYTATSQITFSTLLTWHNAVMEKERVPGGRNLINAQLSDLTRPKEVIQAYYAARGFVGDELTQLVAIDLDRQATFVNYVRSFSFRELVDYESLRIYTQTGRIGPNIDLGLVHAQAHLRHLIWLLHEYSYYELAISTDFDFKENVAVKPSFWILREPRFDSTHLAIEQEKGTYDTSIDAVAGYTLLFDQTWEAMPLCRRTKRAVIQLLENLLIPDVTFEDLAQTVGG